MAEETLTQCATCQDEHGEDSQCPMAIGEREEFEAEIRESFDRIHRHGSAFPNICGGCDSLILSGGCACDSEGGR